MKRMLHTTTTLRFLFLFALQLAAIIVVAQGTTRRWQGLGAGGNNGNLNNRNNWSGNTLPTAADDAEIIINDDDEPIVTLTLTNNLTVKSLRVIVREEEIRANFDVADDTLRVLGSAIFNAGGDDDDDDEETELNVGVLKNGGTGFMDFGGATVFGGNTSGRGVFLAGANREAMLFRGNVTFGPIAGIYSFNPLRDVIFDGIGNQTIRWNNSTYEIKLRNVTVGLGTNATTLVVEGSETDELSGKLTVGRNAILDLGLARWDALSPRGTILDLDAAATLKVGRFFPTDFGEYRFAKTSTVEYYGAINETQLINSAPVYGNLILSRASSGGRANMLAVGSLNIEGDLTIQDETIFNVANYTHSVKGSINSIGVLNPGTAVFTIDGADNQVIGGANNAAFHQLVINKPSGTLKTQGTGITIANRLTLRQGILESASASPLIIGNGATVAGASNASFVSGPVRKAGTNSFTFPIGKGSKYVPVSISAPANATDVFQAEYFVANPDAGAAKDPALKAVSACEYWDVQRVAGNSNVLVTLSWSADNACSGPSYISDPTSIVVTRFNGTTWNNLGGVVAAGSTPASGSVTASASSFSPFTLGSTSLNNTLPVLFVDVQATEQAGGVAVSFANLTESNVAAYYIERSANGTGYQPIATLTAKANNGGKAVYRHLDESPLGGANFYRIRALETTGTVVYSKDVSVDLAGKTALVLYPNPVSKSVNAITMRLTSLPAGAYQLQVYNQQGQLVHSSQMNHTGGSAANVLPLRNLSTGRYILHLNGKVKFIKSFLVQ